MNCSEEKTRNEGRNIELSKEMKERIQAFKDLSKFRELNPGMEEMGFPSLKEKISDVESPEKEAILSYLKEGKPLGLAAPGCYYDKFTGERIGGIRGFTDGEWYWSSQIIYYVEKYNLELPAEFIAKVVTLMEENK